ncbi:hypothetical protein ABZ873_34110, partial [Streptomyces sp. NPDC047014]
ICGLTAHLILAPARHVHHRQEAVADLYTAMSRRLDDLAEILDGNTPDTERVRHWRRDWNELATEAERIRHTIDAEMENSRLHPRRTTALATDNALPRAREAVTIAERTMDHLRSLTRTLYYALDSQEITGLPASFRSACGTLLRTAATALEEIGQTSPTDPRHLADLIDDAMAELHRVERHERATAEAEPVVHTLQGTLLTDISRLLSELRPGRYATTPAG